MSKSGITFELESTESGGLVLKNPNDAVPYALLMGWLEYKMRPKEVEMVMLQDGSYAPRDSDVVQRAMGFVSLFTDTVHTLKSDSSTMPVTSFRPRS